MSIAFILGEYPSVSESFIRNEIFELRKRGIQIIMLAIKKGVGADNENEVIYDGNLIASTKLLAHFYYIFRHSRSYFKALGRILFSGKRSIIQRGRDLKNFSKSIYFLFRLRKTDCMHLHAHFLSQPASIAMMMSSISGLKFSCSAHAHDIYTTPISDLKEKLKRSLFTVTCTRFNKDFLSNLSKEDRKLHHVYHGIDFSKWPQKKFGATFSEAAELHILCVGRLVEKKGIIYLLKAILELKQRGFQVRCNIVGDGPLSGILNDFITDHHLENEINLAGALSADLVVPFYEKADLFVLPCIEMNNGDKDGLPNVLLEALATGIPVITTPVSAIPELIEHHLTGLLVPEHDYLSIAEAIIRLRADQELYNRLIANGRKKVEAFDIKVSTGELFDVFQSYVGGK